MQILPSEPIRGTHYLLDVLIDPNEDSPSSLFKFTKQCYADQMLTKGAFRIGTLHDYRRTEHVVQIQDAGEGTRSTYEYHGNGRIVGTEGSWVANSIFKPVPDRQISLSGIALAVVENHPDCFIYCFSETAQADVETNYDACIEILDPLRFILDLSIAAGFSEPSDKVAFGKCRYVGRDQEVGAELDIPMAFRKPASYMMQQEWRAVWFHTSVSPTAPIDVLCPQAAKLCRQVHFTSGGSSSSSSLPRDY